MKRTKYILHGGFKQNETQQNDLFFQEILKTAPNSTKILLVYFAKEPDRIDANKREDILQFEKNKGGKTLSFEVADEKIFPEQVLHSDVIYLHGGKTQKILDSLKEFENLKSLFHGKIIAADSAGTNALSTYSFSQSSNAILEGTKVLPFKTICHYSEKYKDKIDDLKVLGGDSELLLLAEYQFKVFEQE